MYEVVTADGERGLPATGSPRSRTISELAAFVCSHNYGHSTRVAVDGVTASGKATIAS
jgi:hypothetical protein